MDLSHSLRSAVRPLLRRPAFAITAILTLAGGIAATTVVFSLVYGALLRPLPFPEPEHLAVLYRTADRGADRPTLRRWSFARFERLRETARSFERVAAYGRAELSLGGDNRDPTLLDAEVVSADYFATLRVRAAVGRTFLADEDRTPGTHPVAVLAHGLWTSRYGSDPAAVGRTIHVNGQPVTVIGVMPPGFAGVTGRAELWIPTMMAPRISYAEWLTTDQNFISVLGRLRPGVTLDAARTELAALGERIAEAVPDVDETALRWGATAEPLDEARIDPTNRAALLLLFGAVLFLLLLACANLSGLGIAHGVARSSETAVRLALGAERSTIVRERLLESGMLAALGGGLGVLLASLGVRALEPPAAHTGPLNMYGALGEFSGASVDARVLAFALFVTLVTIALSGLIPALHAGRIDLTTQFRARDGGHVRGVKAQKVIVVGEVALALALSIGAGLLLTSLRQLESRPLGFQPNDRLTFRIHPPDVRYGPADAPALIDRVLAAVTAIPGVRSATVDACAPLGTSCANTRLYIAGREPQPMPFTTRHYVGWDHFTTLGIPLLRGRAFTPEDREGRPAVAIINETAARRLWAGDDPIGQQIWFEGGSFDGSAEIVGVVGDVQYGPIERGMPVSIYTPYRQFTYAWRLVTVHTEGEPLAYVSAVRAAVRSIDDLPITDVRTLEDRLGDAWALTRFIARLTGGFAIVAVLLAALGIYGVLANAVSQRTREMGIRLAVGASPGRVLRLVVGQALLLALVGIGAGLLAAAALSRFLRGLLFGVSPIEPLVYAAQAATLLAAATLASWLPARRAARVDPAITLRTD